MKNKIYEFLSFFYIVFFLILMFNSVIKTIYADIALKTYADYIYIVGGVGLILYICSKIKNCKFSKYEIIVFIMMILSCLSLISALDINTAIFGKLNRYEGLLVWLSYYIFLLNAMNIKNRTFLYIIVFLVSSYMLINLYYGLYQVGILSSSNLFYIRWPTDYASGYLGNPNFFGSLSSIFYGLILGLFIKVKFGWRKYLLIIVLLVADLAIVMSCSMSAIVTIVVINLLCLIEIIVLIIKKRKHAFVYLGSLVFGILSFVSVFYIYSINRSTIRNDAVDLFNQSKNMLINKKMDGNYGSGRIEIWKNTLEKLPEVPITGYGIDNFHNFYDNPVVTDDYIIIVDKAHNDYLQKAVCEGIISSVIFIVFLLMIFFKGLFGKLSPVYYGLLLAFTCYSIQAFFSISFINVAPIYFIVMGLLIGGLKEKKKEDLVEKESTF